MSILSDQEVDTGGISAFMAPCVTHRRPPVMAFFRGLMTQVLFLQPLRNLLEAAPEGPNLPAPGG